MPSGRMSSPGIFFQDENLFGINRVDLDLVAQYFV